MSTAVFNKVCFDFPEFHSESEAKDVFEEHPLRLWCDL